MNDVKKKKPEPCRFCAIALEEVLSADAAARAIARFGITPVGVNKWRVLRCPDCGSLELFLVER